MEKNKWSREFPETPGFYWFFGVRFERKDKPELMLVDAKKCSNGMLYIANGHFMFRSEVVYPYFLPADLPDTKEVEREIQQRILQYNESV